MRALISGIFLFTFALTARGQAAKPDFAKDVQPILQRKCVVCHNARLAQNGVRFDDGEEALKGGYSGAVIVAGKASESKVIERVVSEKAGHRMPPSGPPLSAADVATLRSWIDAGAVWPKGAVKAAAKPKVDLWSFQPLAQPKAPEVKRKDWARNAIDQFVLARLEKEGVAPSPEANRTTLMRRVSLDLTGLPPTPREVQAFLDDKSDDAYERLVERLLGSPHFGERMARQWLDLARYADSDGFEKDKERPWAWRWRNWVIDAYNADMPFDRFTVEQLAGDLLPKPTQQQLIATGFHRNALVNREGGIDPRENRFEQMVNRTNTTSTVWLGLTLGCAQCHDHKYDPLSQRDYYSMYAFFNKAKERDVAAPMAGEIGPWLKTRAEYLAEREHLMKVYDIDMWLDDYCANMVKALDGTGQNLEWDFEIASSRPMFDYYEEVVRTPRAKRDPRDQERLLYHFMYQPGPSQGPDSHKADMVRDFRDRLRRLDEKYPKLAQAMVMEEYPTPPETHIAIKGDYRENGLKVAPAPPANLPPLPEGVKRDRLALAQWLVSKENPLTPRVTVNRLWQEMFGHGIVSTSEDFGTTGEKPTHPELLDWLAAEFRDNGWSTKQMVRLMVTSSTYRQSSNTRPDLQEKDPANTLLARQSRLRMPGELVRDSALLASGLLNDTVGGPSVKPYQPAGVAELGYAGSVKWVESEGAQKYRRGLYVHFQRTTPYPMLMNFDAPDSNVACSRRRRSNSPLQALNLLNDPVFVEASQGFAARLVTEFQEAERLEQAFLLALGRLPSEAERGRMKKFLDEQATLLAKDQAQAKKLLPLAPENAHWASLARVLLNTDEFITRE